MDEIKIDEYMVDAELIQAVMLKGDLPKLVSEHVELKRTGKYYKGICPFCKSDKFAVVVFKPSSIFRCYNCNKGGDLFKFVELFYEMDFLNAVVFLARKYKISP